MFCAVNPWCRLPAPVVPLFLLSDPATTDIHTLSLHDALPISLACRTPVQRTFRVPSARPFPPMTKPSPNNGGKGRDRKSTRLNSSHRCISYAVFCLKKKKRARRKIPKDIRYVEAPHECDRQSQ